MRRALALVFATLSLGACSLAVTTALDEVGCEQEGRVGPPACRKGQICRSGTCRSCASAEVCGNGVDDDCNGSVDDGCPGGAGGAGGVAGASGAAGVAGASAGAAGSKAGAAGAASTGGTGGGSAGTGGAGGAGAGAGGVSAGGAGAGSGGGGAGGASGGAAGAAPTYGAACTSPSECPFGALCETLAKLGESMSGKVCTKPCCNSSECGQVGDGAACIPVQAGTGMCLKAAPFGRPKLGMGVTGDACGTDGGLCRSGFCDGGKCNDVCCKDAACSGSDECVRRQITVGTPRWAYACGKAVGGLDANKVCSDDGECRTNACLVREDTITNLTFCSSPCCNSQACGAVVVLGQQFPVSCRYVQQGSASQWLRTCTSVASGGAATGASCTGNADCRSDFCIPGTSGSYCSDACCSDGDCPPSLKCRPFVPSNSTVGVLRCIQ